MDITNLLPKPFFIGSAGTAKFARGERAKQGQGLSFAPNGQPGDTLSGLPDWLYHSDPQIRKSELAGYISVAFSSAPDSGVAQPELLGLGGIGADQVLALQERRHSTNVAAWRTAARTMLDFSNINPSPIALHWNQVSVPGGANSAELRLRDASGGVDLVVVTGIITTGSQTVLLGAAPIGLKLVALQHQVTGGGFSRIEGAALYAG